MRPLLALGDGCGWVVGVDEPVNADHGPFRPHPFAGRQVGVAEGGGGGGQRGREWSVSNAYTTTYTHTRTHTHTHINTHTRTHTRTHIATRPAAPRVWSAKDDANLLRLCRRFLFDFERVAVELSTRFEVTTADACRLQYAMLEMRESVLLL